MLDLIPAGPARVDRARDLPAARRARRPSYGVALPGYWLDIGTPEAYLQAHRDVLERNFVTELGDGLGSDYTLVAEGAEVSPSARLVPPVFVGPGARIGAGARIGSLAVIGAERGRRRGCVGRVVGDRSRRDRRRTHARRPARSSASRPSSAPSARCAGLRSSALARRSATGICSTTACGSPRARRSPPERCTSRDASARLAEHRLARPLGLRRAPKVEKPWGHELIWALTEAYCGKVLFVKAGAALSLQFHSEKDESWLVQSGRAKLELGEVGQQVLHEEVVGPGPPSATGRARCTASPRSRTRRSSRSRRRSSTTSSGSRIGTGARAPRHLANLATPVVRFARCRSSPSARRRADRLVGTDAALPRDHGARRAGAHAGRLPPLRPPRAEPAAARSAACASASRSSWTSSPSPPGFAASPSSAPPSTPGSPAGPGARLGRLGAAQARAAARR